ncbi:DoxX family protein [Pedobacter metabolipauper]|uniref:DoxX-like protein n=1 Tax=Pedobacter metabolipauper TaxID=425513 RepID=A0A4R6SV32_9SPHI|nr:DoxX family protein [Pedobacter metabolipauper]TDQ08211.1 hypothetical protein ATK78_2718 [Pedobacter metabolipauper]
MKIAVIIVRSLIGLLLLFASVSYFLNLVPQPELTGNMKIFNEGMAASGYLMTLVKITELICGIGFITGRFVTLANVVIFPIVINILLVHGFMAPEGLGAGIFLFLGVLFLAYYHRDNYRSLFVAKSFSPRQA